MDARKFFFVSAGVLCLAGAYHLGAQRARADWSGVGFVVAAGNGQTVWNSFGEAYDRLGTPGWLRVLDLDLPVPVADVKILDSYGSQVVLVTHADAVWVRLGGGWVLYPPVPGGAVGVAEDTFGKSKAAFR